MLTPDQQKANRCALAHRDMNEVLKYLDAYDELNTTQKGFGDSRYFDHCEAILMASIVTYCRSFMRSRSEAKAASMLDTSDFVFLLEASELGSLHSLLLSKRKKAIAHADWEEHNTELIENGVNSGVLRRISVPSYVNGLNVGLFRQLADEVRKACLSLTYDLDIEASNANSKH